MRLTQKRLGTICIALSLLIFVLLGLPFLIAHLPQKQPIIGDGYYISVPKINALSRVIPGVDPWNATEYHQALRFGVAQAKGTVSPGQDGLIYLFAHSSGMPWEILTTNIPFLRLGEVNTGDEIDLFQDHKEYRYLVFTKKIVAASDTQYLTDRLKNVLILQTCWPIGTDWQRLLVFARPQKFLR